MAEVGAPKTRFPETPWVRVQVRSEVIQNADAELTDALRLTR